jgi:hypothetical protein
MPPGLTRFRHYATGCKKRWKSSRNRRHENTKERQEDSVQLQNSLENHGWEWRCYMRDPDGYLIEVGQYTEIALDWFNNRS